MPNEPYSTAELDALLAGAVDLALDDTQMARLEQLLSEPQAIDYYVDHVILHAMLQWEHTQPPNGLPDSLEPQPLPDAASEQLAEHGGFLGLGFLDNAIDEPVGYFSSGWPVAYLVAAVILSVGLLLGSVVYVSSPVQVVDSTLPYPLSSLPTSSQFVARITGMVDCQWSDPSTEAFNGANVPLGRKFALSSGLMEITYHTGAKVILQGPVTYEVESSAGGFLSVGKLTAKVEKKATSLPSPSGRGAGGEGSEKNEELSASRSSFLIPHSYFAVRTRTATVTDLGTEFGVEVSGTGTTETHVFAGTVKLEGRGEAGGAAEQLLRAGQAAKLVPHAGAVEMVTNGTQHFVRKMPVVKTGGSRELIDQVDYSDTWTANSVTRPGSYLMLVDPVSMRVEQSHGNPLRSWVFGTESAMTTWSRYDKSAIVWPGFQVQGTRSGFMECGGDCCFGFEYGLRNDFVVQFDAVQTDDRMNITIGDAPATVEGARQLSVFFRSAGARSRDSRLSAAEIGVYHPLSKTGEVDAGFHSGIAKSRQWHNYAMRFNLPAKRLTVWVDRQYRGTIDLAALKHEDSAPAWDELSISNRYVSIGGYNGGEDAGPVWTPLWVDNFRIGSPCLTDESSPTEQGASASSPQRGGD